MSEQQFSEQGPKIVQTDNDAINGQDKCPKCGAKVSPKQKFCPECGHKLYE